MPLAEGTTEWYMGDDGIAHGTSKSFGSIWTYCGASVNEEWSAVLDTPKCPVCMDVQEALGRGKLDDTYDMAHMRDGEEEE